MSSHYIGKTNEGDVFVFINRKNDNLSITGVIKPTPKGNAASCGQINMHLDVSSFVKWAKGWDGNRQSTLLRIWERWHLNDLKAGSPVQEAFVMGWKAAGNDYDYKIISGELELAGMSPDADGYRYGTAWKREEVPEHVWAFLAELPEGKQPPEAWRKW